MPKPSAGSDPVQPIREARRDRPFVVAQLGQSLDGRIATLSGESRWINAGGALDHVHRIRATVDAVMVGVGTVVADDPLLNVRRVEGRHPVRVVIDPTGRVQPTRVAWRLPTASAGSSSARRALQRQQTCRAAWS